MSRIAVNFWINHLKRTYGLLIFGKRFLFNVMIRIDFAFDTFVTTWDANVIEGNTVLEHLHITDVVNNLFV